MNLLEEIANQLNLRWAWEKVKASSVPGDVWFDEVEIASFELDLHQNLSLIGKEISEGKYKLRKIRPMPFPKAAGDDGEQRIRQYFHIAIRDQVAWVAVVNVIGPLVDFHMPNWSYGNRLFRNVWVEEKESGSKIRRVGRYRHSNGRIYLPFKQSWPIYRRHVYLTTRAMSRLDFSGLSDEDNLEYELVSSLSPNNQCKFIFKDFWNVSPSIEKAGLYWCSLDFEKFYPSIKNQIIIKNILKILPDEFLNDATLLLSTMLSFEIDFDGLSDEDISNLQLDRAVSEFYNIPTGLYVSGFLANAALLNIDIKVEKLLQKERRIAHFRFVDDHIIMAHNFDDLINWIDRYLAIINESSTGCRINHEKTEPKELSNYLLSRDQCDANDNYSAAKSACELDSEFPSPLMTKTLALVSGIGKANFNLMEEGELSGMMAQLEHMLLVELPETEIPERTRLAFAATRLANIAQVRLENHIVINDFSSAVPKQVGIHELGKNPEMQALEVSYDSHMGEISRVFSLLKKVLRDRPDRVRLWTRAILLCRQTGLQKLGEIFLEIKKIGKVNTLASEYLMANTLALVGSNALLASKIIKDSESAIWRKLAAYRFLQDVASLKSNDIKPKKIRHDLIKSWRLFSFGVYCANININDDSISEEFGSIDFPVDILRFGRKCLSGENATALAWWASRMCLSGTDARADHLTMKIGKIISNKADSSKYWQNYPCDIPLELIEREIKDSQTRKGNSNNQGWWFDVINYNRCWFRVDSDLIVNKSAKKSFSNDLYFLKNVNYRSLLDWTLHVSSIAQVYPSDPRVSEWTSLEMVRQIAETLRPPLVLDKNYVETKGRSNWQKNGVHPANYMIPIQWFEAENVSWQVWRDIVVKHPLLSVPNEYRIFDYRFSPLIKDTSDLNAIRGIGIVLACLLKRSFELPSIWNGKGQADVLKLLPKLLMKRITCSSYTLGILQSCLNSRVLENTLRRNERQYNMFFDDDTENDPVSFVQLEDLMHAFKFCQKELIKYQLSTLNQQARQLTPIDIRLLTDPNWSKVFVLGEYLDYEE